jgi:hypothetical protein
VRQFLQLAAVETHKGCGHKRAAWSHRRRDQSAKCGNWIRRFRRHAYGFTKTKLQIHWRNIKG